MPITGTWLPSSSGFGNGSHPSREGIHGASLPRWVQESSLRLSTARPTARCCATTPYWFSPLGRSISRRADNTAPASSTSNITCCWPANGSASGGTRSIISQWAAILRSVSALTAYQLGSTAKSVKPWLIADLLILQGRDAGARSPSCYSALVQKSRQYRSPPMAARGAAQRKAARHPGSYRRTAAWRRSSREGLHEIQSDWFHQRQQNELGVVAISEQYLIVERGAASGPRAPRPATQARLRIRVKGSGFRIAGAQEKPRIHGPADRRASTMRSATATGSSDKTMRVPMSGPAAETAVNGDIQAADWRLT